MATLATSPPPSADPWKWRFLVGAEYIFWLTRRAHNSLSARTQRLQSLYLLGASARWVRSVAPDVENSAAYAMHLADGQPFTAGARHGSTQLNAVRAAGYGQ